MNVKHDKLNQSHKAIISRKQKTKFYLIKLVIKIYNVDIKTFIIQEDISEINISTFLKQSIEKMLNMYLTMYCNKNKNYVILP